MKLKNLVTKRYKETPSDMAPTPQSASPPAPLVPKGSLLGAAAPHGGTPSKGFPLFIGFYILYFPNNFLRIYHTLHN